MYVDEHDRLPGPARLRQCCRLQRSHINGYLSTVLVLFTLLTNCLVCIVLMRRHMRTPTNALLVAMAVSTTLTGVCPIPAYIYFYVLGHYGDWYSWCFVNHLLTDHLPTIFHTASIWITVALAVQRYLTVCQSSDTSKRWCTVRTVVRVVVIIHVVAFACQLCRMLELQYVPVEFQSRIDPAPERHRVLRTFCGGSSPKTRTSTSGCTTAPASFSCTSCPVSPSPCSTRCSSGRCDPRRRDDANLLTQHRKSESRRVGGEQFDHLDAGSGRLRVPAGRVPARHRVPPPRRRQHLRTDRIQPNSTNKASEVINLLILFSYPINFFIYCGMSKQFRETFKVCSRRRLLHHRHPCRR